MASIIPCKQVSVSYLGDLVRAGAGGVGTTRFWAQPFCCLSLREDWGSGDLKRVDEPCQKHSLGFSHVLPTSVFMTFHPGCTKRDFVVRTSSKKFCIEEVRPGCKPRDLRFCARGILSRHGHSAIEMVLCVRVQTMFCPLKTKQLPAPSRTMGLLSVAICCCEKGEFISVVQCLHIPGERDNQLRI